MQRPLLDIVLLDRFPSCIILCTLSSGGVGGIIYKNHARSGGIGDVVIISRCTSRKNDNKWYTTIDGINKSFCTGTS